MSDFDDPDKSQSTVYANILQRQNPELLGLVTGFLAVVETGSFAAASKILRQTPSTVSRKILKLEELLGVRLLNRTTRSVVITEPGKRYLSYCKALAETISNAEVDLSLLSQCPQGLLRLSMPVAFGEKHVTPILPEFLARNPKIEIESTYTDAISNLIEDDIDLAIRIGELPDSTSIARKLVSNRRLLVASPKYLKENGRPSHPNDLGDHNCIRYIRYRSSGNIWKFVESANHDNSISVPVSGSFRCDDSNAVLAFALSDGGIGIIADYICNEALNSGKLIRLMPDWEVVSPTSIYICWPSTRLLAPKVRLLIDHLVETLGNCNFHTTEPTN